MATVTLTKIWVNLLSTGLAVSGQSRERPRQHAIDGEVRTYAGGRQRSVTTLGESGKFAFTLVRITEANITTLRSWFGQVVSVRDHRGQRYVGTFYELVPIEAKDDITAYDVTIELKFVTYTEGV